MAALKTVENDASVQAYLDAIEPESRRQDCIEVHGLMRRITGLEAKMWGANIVGFGRYHYKYDSGREGDYLMTGFASRKQALTIYIMPGYGSYGELMAKLGKYKLGKSCLYVKRLADIDRPALETLIASAYATMRRKYPS